MDKDKQHRDIKKKTAGITLMTTFMAYVATFQCFFRQLSDRRKKKITLKKKKR